MEIEEFNWNLRHFLDTVSRFQKDVNKANPTTLELLDKTIDKIDKLLENVDEVDDAKTDAILCNFDETKFDIERQIFCRICKVSFEATRIKYMLHLADYGHNANLLRLPSLEPAKPDLYDTNNNNNNNSDQSDPKDVIDQNVPHSLPANSTKDVKKDVSSAVSEVLAKLDKKMKASSSSLSAQESIPNVFDDKIYDFIESNTKPAAEYHPPNVVSKTKYDFPKNPSKPLNWRERPTEPAQTNPTEQNQPFKPRYGPVLPLRKTADVIQNGAILEGTEFQPCPTYELNNLYIKFPHLNSNKVANPLVAPAGASSTHDQKHSLSDFFDMVNREDDKKVKMQQKSKVGRLSDKNGSDMSNSYASLLAILNSDPNSTKVEANGKIGRSVSSDQIQLSGISKVNGSFPAKGNRRGAQQQQAQANGSGRTKGNDDRRENNQNDARSKGAIPKQPMKDDRRNAMNNKNNNKNANSKNSTPFTQENSQQKPKNEQKSQTKNLQNTPQIQKHDQNNKQKTMSEQKNQKLKQNDQKISEIGQSGDNNNNNNTEQKAPEKIQTADEPAKLQPTIQPKNMDALNNEDKLKKFFLSDVTAIVSLMVNFNMRQDNLIARKKVLDSVENTLKGQFKTVKCHLIGSYAYNIAKGGLGPLDIYLDLHESFNNDKTGQVFITGMNETLKLFSQRNDWIVGLLDLSVEENASTRPAKTRYDTLSVLHKASNIKCIFSFGTGVGVRNTEVVKSLFAAQPVAHQLVICVRTALQEGGVKEWTSNFTGYVISLLVIAYLQTIGKLPSVQSLQVDVPTIKCGENAVQFKTPTNVAICKDRIRDLLIGFFSYYAAFDYANKIISPFEGGEIHQNFRIRHSESLSQSMRRFKNFIDNEPSRWVNKMCVQDIFEHKRNVTQNVTTMELKAFRVFCSKALNAIRDAGSQVKY